MPDEDNLATPQPTTLVEAAEQPAEQRRSMSLVETGQTDFMNPNVYIQMKALANDFITSQAVPKGFTNAAQVLMAFQVGYEMGMKPAESLKSLYLVNGQFNIWGPAVVRRLKLHGWKEPVYQESENACKAVLEHKDGRTLTDEPYTFEDAEASGYTKDNYGKLKVGWKPGVNRRLKLRYGALSVIVKTYLPEVLGSAADIAEVAIDVPLQEEAEAKTNKDVMAAAVAERQNLEKAQFAPQAQEAKVAPAPDQV